MSVNEMDPRLRGDDTKLVVHAIDKTVIPAQAGIHLTFEVTGRGSSQRPAAIAV